MLILHHLGLGDHIICHGLVRTMCERNPTETIHLFCKPHNEISVRFMYEKISNLELHIGFDEDAFAFARQNPQIPMLEIGFTKLELDGALFDCQFYEHAKLPLEYRWDKFACPVDSRTTEQCSLFKTYREKYGIVRNKYIFVHDDKSRGFGIDESVLPPDMPIIRPEVGLTPNIFDYHFLLQQAAEIHCIDSSFKHIVESLFYDSGSVLHNFNGPSLHYHTYVRGSSAMFTSSSRCNWKIINKK